MHYKIEECLEPARGYFDRIEYVGGKLIIGGWLLVPGRRIDKTLLFINSQFVREFEILQKTDVANVFPFIPHAKYSGFSIAETISIPEDAMTGICVVALENDTQIGQIQTCYSRIATDKLIVRDKHLMHRVAHTESVAYFQASGFKSFADFWGLTVKYADPAGFKTVLDWGCGCGRLIEILAYVTRNLELYGCDIDSEAIGWCTRNLKTAKFNTIPPFPPTEYPDNFFDLVIGNSVLTHLTRDVQILWLKELRRIMRPNGVLLATVHGESATFFQFYGKLQEVLKDGIHDGNIDNSLKDIAPDNYYRGTFQSEEYTKREFGKHFEIADYIKKGSANFQDIVVMRKN